MHVVFEWNWRKKKGSSKNRNITPTTCIQSTETEHFQYSNLQAYEVGNNNDYVKISSIPISTSQFSFNSNVPILEISSYLILENWEEDTTTVTCVYFFDLQSDEDHLNLSPEIIDNLGCVFLKNMKQTCESNLHNNRSEDFLF